MMEEGSKRIELTFANSPMVAMTTLLHTMGGGKRGHLKNRFPLSRLAAPLRLHAAVPEDYPLSSLCLERVVFGGSTRRDKGSFLVLEVWS